jgi:hypothetical protein
MSFCEEGLMEALLYLAGSLFLVFLIGRAWFRKNKGL